jgi:hypothetical protein
MSTLDCFVYRLGRKTAVGVITKLGSVMCAEDVAICQSLQTVDKQALEDPGTDTFCM